jgi:hypothetical protein
LFPRKFAPMTSAWFSTSWRSTSSITVTLRSWVRTKYDNYP